MFFVIAKNKNKEEEKRQEYRLVEQKLDYELKTYFRV